MANGIGGLRGRLSHRGLWVAAVLLWPAAALAADGAAAAGREGSAGATDAVPAATSGAPRAVPDPDALPRAVARGNLEETAALLKRGADTDGRLGGRTALMIAAERGRRDLVDRLLAGGARVKAVTERGETALLFAVRGGHREAALALLARGADANDTEPTTDVLGRPVPPSPGAARASAATAAAPNGAAGTRGPQPPPVGRSVLRIAVDNGDVALAEALLAHGAAVKTPRAGDPPILAAALAHGDSAMALALLKRGAGLTPELDTAWTARVLPVPPGAERLLTPPARPRAKRPPPASPPGAPVVLPPGVGDPPAPDLPTVTQTAWTPLMAAAICCDAAVIKALLAKGAKVATTTADGQTALSLAVAYDRLEAVRVLLARGAAVNAKDAAGRTPLSLAVVYGRTALVSELLAKGAAVDVRDQAGRTPLLAAITAGQHAAVAVLLAHGADANAKDAAGRTALALAVGKGDAALVAALLDHGAAADLGETGAALRDALGRGEAAVVQTLLDHGVPATTPEHADAVCAAAVQGQDVIVAALLAKGANADCRTRGDEPASCDRHTDPPRSYSSLDRCAPGQDWTPLRAAADLGHLGVVRVLVDYGVDVNAKGADGVTALTAALERQHLATAVLLLEQGAVIDRTAGGIALCDAIVHNPALALALIDKGADVEGKEGGCYYGMTPLLLAVERGYSRIAERLRQAGATP